MKAEVIAVGSELTSGAKLDTNSQWLSQQLADLGIRVHFHSTVADELAENVAVLKSAASRADLVLITGGLGPTLDDLTRQALAEMVGVELVLNQPALETIRTMFASRGRTMPRRNEVQAMFPAGSEPLDNPIGTAPGIWLEHRISIPDDSSIRDASTSEFHLCRIAAMPGVPSEMYRMFDEQVRPRLLLSGSVIRHARLNCFGLGESHIEELLGDLTARGRDPEVGITAHEATITLRISAHGTTREECDAKINATIAEARRRLGHYVFGIEDEELEDIVVRQLIDRGLSLAAVESGTGGLLSHRLMTVPGCETCFAGGLILPTEASQRREFPVDIELYRQHGIISQAVTEQLATCCRNRFGAAFALAVTADRGDSRDAGDSHPAAFVSLARPNGVRSLPVQQLANPHIHRSRTVKAALNLLRLELLSLSGDS